MHLLHQPMAQLGNVLVRHLAYVREEQVCACAARIEATVQCGGDIPGYGSLNAGIPAPSVLGVSAQNPGCTICFMVASLCMHSWSQCVPMAALVRC